MFISAGTERPHGAEHDFAAPAAATLASSVFYGTETWRAAAAERRKGDGPAAAKEVAF